MKTFTLSFFFLLSSLVSASDWIATPIDGCTPSVSSVDSLDGRFVAWGDGLMVSEDGVNWTTVPLPLDGGRISSVFVVNGQWVLFAEESTGQRMRLISTDLKRWARDRIPGSFGWGIIYAKGKFFEIRSHRLHNSPDGLTWQEVPIELETVDTLTAIVELEDTLYLLGWDRYWTSEDGVEWNEIQAPFLSRDGSGNGVYQAVSFKGWTFAVGNGFHRSQDRQQWQSLFPLGIHGDAAVTGDEGISQLFPTDEALYAVTSTGRMLFTHDGTHWGTTGRKALPQPMGPGLIVLQYRLAADDMTRVCTDGKDLFCQARGGDWQRVSDASWPAAWSQDGFAPQWFAGRYVVGGPGAQLWSSEDGVVWRTDFRYAGVQEWSSIIDPDSFWGDSFRLAQGGGQLLAIGRGDWVLATEDGRLWRHHWTTLDGQPMWDQIGSTTEGYSDSIEALRFVDGRWISTSTAGNPIQSANGIHWVSEARAPEGLEFVRIHRMQDGFVGAGTWLYFSTDGQNWEAASVEGLTEAESTWWFVNLKRFAEGYVVGWNGGAIFRSVDGRSWSRIEIPLEGFVPSGNISQIGDALYLAMSQGSAPFLRMDPDGTLSPVHVLPATILEVEGDAPQALALSSRLGGAVLLRPHELPHPVLKVTALVDTLSELDSPQPAFALTRHGDVSQSLEVILDWVGSATVHTDFGCNLEQRGDNWVLRFESGYSVLHVWLEPVQDGLQESEESVGLWIRPDHAYRVMSENALATLLLTD
ncbi:MAG: hypothetical protein ABQ298_06875 [Puniceicoccaceae bacterium]